MDIHYTWVCQINLLDTIVMDTIVLVKTYEFEAQRTRRSL